MVFKLKDRTENSSNITLSMFEKFKTGFQAAMVETGRQGVEVLLDSWMVFSDPRIETIQVGPYKLSLETGIESVNLDWLNFSDMKPGDRFSFKNFYFSYSHIQNTSLPGSKVSGSNAAKSINPIADLIYAQGSPSSVITTPNQIALLPDILKLQENIGQRVTYSELQETDMSLEKPLLPMQTWRGTPSVSSQGKLALLIEDFNIGMQTYLFGYKLLFNLLEQIVNSSPLENKIFQTLAQSIWDMRFHLGELEFKEDPTLFIVKDSPSHRYAVTGDSPGSPIYLNSQLLLPGKKTKIEDAVALLGHELAHHTGLKDGPDRFLDEFGAILKARLLTQKLYSELKTNNGENFHVEIYNFIKENGQSYSQLLTRDSNGWVDLTPSFFTNINGAAKDFKVGNIKQNSIERYSNVDAISFSVDLAIEGGASESLTFQFLGKNSNFSQGKGFFINDNIFPKIELKKTLNPNTSPINFKAIHAVTRNQVIKNQEAYLWEVDFKIESHKKIEHARVVYSWDSRVNSPIKLKQDFDFTEVRISKQEEGLKLSAIQKLPLDLSKTDFVIKGIEVLYTDGTSELLLSKFRITSGEMGVVKDPIKLNMKLHGQMMGNPLGFNISTPESPGEIALSIDNVGELYEVSLELLGQGGIYTIRGIGDNKNPMVKSLQKKCTAGHCDLLITLNHNYITKSLNESYLSLNAVYIKDHSWNEGVFRYNSNSFFKFE